MLDHESPLEIAMKQFSTGGKSPLIIGVSPFQNLFLIPAVLTKVRETFPDIQVVIHESNSKQLRMNAAEGKSTFPF